jgi:hypothetical protein
VTDRRACSCGRFYTLLYCNRFVSGLDAEIGEKCAPIQGSRAAHRSGGGLRCDLHDRCTGGLQEAGGVACRPAGGRAGCRLSRRRRRSPPPESDGRLLGRVESTVSRSVPAPMEPSLELESGGPPGGEIR